MSLCELGMVTKKAKPRVRFCWVCSRKLYGNHYREVIFKGDGRAKIVHAQCKDKVNAEPGPEDLED